MQTIDFATTNQDKFKFGYDNCRQAGIELLQQIIETDEVQGEDPIYIVTQKALAAYAKLQRPVLVSDDSWSILSLGGFPGAYMKSINHWFRPDDFLRLMSGKTGSERKIELHAYICYTDGHNTEVFSSVTAGRILEEARGTHMTPALSVISLDQDNGLSLAEVLKKKANLADREGSSMWHDFCAWYASLQ